MSDYNRRRFVQAAAVAAGAKWGLLGANDRVNLGVVGVGRRGRDHVSNFSRLPDCRIAALCDINQAARERGAALVEKAQGVKPKTYTDMRRMFEDKDIDAVSVSAPNHWHALATIWACQAGKDVYCEKPASHNMYEGRKMVEAARKYQRMVQVGSQSRTIVHKQRAIELLRQGIIGKLYMAKGLCFKRRPSIGHTPDEPVPPGVDWDLFLGPAPLRPFSKNRFDYNWHWFWDTGNGDIGNQGVHELDIARWGLGKNELPKTVISTGGKYVYVDDQETPNTQLATFDYGDCEIIFEVRGLLTGGEDGVPLRGRNAIGNIFYGSEGYLAVDSLGFQVYKGEKREKVMDEKPAEEREWDPAPHMANFLNAVRTRNHQDLTADIETGAVSAALGHMANISYRAGKKLAFDAAAFRFDDAAANRLISRDYRAPYIVPEKV